MKNIFFKSILFCGVSTLASVTFAQRYERNLSCETSSRGMSFRAEGRNAEAEAVNSCVRARVTSESQCEDNLRCSNVSDGRPDEGGFPGFRGSVGLDARFRSCQRGNLCSYDISWTTRSRQSVAVTVEMPREGGGERLFACADRDGSQRADWIQPGKPYVFRAYAVNDCRDSRNTGRGRAAAMIRVLH